jgi:4-amino-4-deoxy-L-arabinose transferase-like glycosyltransferase
MGGPLARVEQFFAARGTGFWLAALAAMGALIYLPYLGSFPLWDPWEPHYSQVAWEMGEHDTWLNPYYRGRDEWWSKPIVMLWMLRASFAVLWDPATDFAGGELASRLPFALTAIIGGLLHFDWVRRLYGRTIGVLAALVLMTAPQYLLIGHQTMADMPFVVATTAALGYLAVGLFTGVKNRGHVRVSRTKLVRVPDFFCSNWPFIAFWGLQAIALITKGFVPPVLAVLILAGYAAGTFRWRDYAELTRERRWPKYLVLRGALTVLGLAAGVALALMVTSSMSGDQRLLYRALVIGPTSVAAVLLAWHDLPPIRHALALLRRIRAAWGLALFFAIGAPWYIYMSREHGWPFWNEFIFYHHLGRAAGTIDKPSHSFEFYLRQVGFGLFPWSAFLLPALWQVAMRASVHRSIAERRNFFVLLCAVMPYLFFTLAGTKFAHYVFPVLPFVAVLLAATLVWLGGGSTATPALAEEGPPLGPPVPSHDSEPLWWQRPGAKGELVVAAALSLVAFGILAQDLAQDFRFFLRLFTYYQTRGTPLDYQPFIVLQVLFTPAAIAIASLLFTRYVTRWQLGVFTTSAVLIACYLGWVVMPSMRDTFSYEPLYHAYNRLAPEQEPVGQYNNWMQPERSVIFLFQNRAEHLKTDKLALAFLQRPGKKFVIVDKDRLADLRRVANEAGIKLYVVAKDHAYARLLSNVPSDEPAEPHILSELPPEATAANVNFDDTFTLVGWQLEPPVVAPGDAVKASFFFRADKLAPRSWEIFIHGDGPRGSQNRIHGDHFPVEGRYLTNEWQPGEIVKDTFELEVPRDFPYESFTLWTGFYVDETRLPVKSTGVTDGDQRVRGPVVRVRKN